MGLFLLFTVGGFPEQREMGRVWFKGHDLGRFIVHVVA